jgi:hypothetical protein
MRSLKYVGTSLKCWTRLRLRESVGQDVRLDEKAQDHIAHCKSVANPWRDHFFAVLRGKIAVRSRISHFTHK